MTWPVPPAVPILPMIAKIRIFWGHAKSQIALDHDPHVLGGLGMKVLVANTCSTSDVPMPKASAPNAQ